MSEPKVKSSGIKISGEGIAMDPIINICNGLNKSDRKFKEVPLSEVKAYLARHKDSYERTNPIETHPEQVLNRAFIDLDGDAGDIGKREFEELVDNITMALKLGITEPVCIMEASEHQLYCSNKDGEVSYKNKLSFRLQFLKKHGSKLAIMKYVNDSEESIANILKEVGVVLTKDETITPRLTIDYKVYNGNRKMRMLGSSKDHGYYNEHKEYIPLYKEERPNKIVSDDHTVEDTLITYIPEDSEPLPEPTAVQLREPTEPKRTVTKKEKASADPVAVEASTDGDKEDANTALLTRAIMGLSAKFWNDYEGFIRVGFICFNEGLDLSVWEEFAKQSPKNKRGDCATHWRGFKKGNLTQATLWKWLKADNPVLYAELAPKRNDFLNLVGLCNHAEVAKYFYNLKPDAYLYNEDLKWFQLMPSNAWKHYERSPSGLLNDIWGTMKAVFNEHHAIQKAKPLAENTAFILKGLLTFAKDIGNKHFLEGVAGMLHTFYNDDDLTKKMDESRHLFAFADKVVDFDSPTPIARDIKPSDYICLHTGYRFPSKSNPVVREEIQKVLMSIWEDEEMVKYVMRVIAVNLHGKKKFEEFYVWTGKGGNGKGMMTEIIKRTFGDYFHSIPNSCLTKNASTTDAPNPPIAQSKGKRFVQAQEPESDDTLKEGTIKQYTGGDEISARLLYGNTVKQVPQWGLFLQCNTIPTFNSSTGGSKRRMRVIRFPFQFVEKPKQKHERQGNPDLKDKIAKSDAWRDEFFLMLMEAFTTIKSSMNTPKSVLEDTEEYFASTNPLRDWLKADYDTGLDVNAKIYWLSAKELKRDFLEKHREHTSMADSIFKGYMEGCGVMQERKSNKFKCGMEERPAGSYYVGIMRKAI